MLLKRRGAGGPGVAPPPVLPRPSFWLVWNFRLGVSLVGTVEAGALEGHADGVVALA